MDALPWLARLGRFLLPLRCLLCGADGHDGIELCAGCTEALVLNRFHCDRCALPLARTMERCTDCAKTARPWQRAWVPYRYAWPLDLLETRFKFGGDLVAGKVLSRRWIAAGAPPGLPQAIVPVPLHAARLRERGFNQALELARPLARHHGIPLRPELLQRLRSTDAQSELDAEARAANIRDAFVASVPPGLGHVAVVDDVMTTGATLEACTLALQRAGVARVDVWALARTAKPGYADL
ncbi:ComF family protein [Luteibacter sp.]|uniref:ComF family protein n=1 Tax=Luteibacter sp. TaxID=1886636 RepID=UPI003F81E36E